MGERRNGSTPVRLLLIALVLLLALAFSPMCAFADDPVAGDSGNQQTYQLSIKKQGDNYPYPETPLAMPRPRAARYSAASNSMQTVMFTVTVTLKDAQGNPIVYGDSHGMEYELYGATSVTNNGDGSYTFSVVPNYTVVTFKSLPEGTQYEVVETSSDENWTKILDSSSGVLNEVTAPSGVRKYVTLENQYDSSAEFSIEGTKTLKSSSTGEEVRLQGGDFTYWVCWDGDARTQNEGHLWRDPYLPESTTRDALIRHYGTAITYFTNSADGSLHASIPVEGLIYGEGTDFAARFVEEMRELGLGAGMIGQVSTPRNYVIYEDIPSDAQESEDGQYLYDENYVYDNSIYLVTVTGLEDHMDGTGEVTELIVTKYTFDAEGNFKSKSTTTTLSGDTVSGIDFENEAKVGDVSLTKETVDASGEPTEAAGRTFEFAVTLSAEGTYDWASSDGTTGTIASGGTLGLSAGETVTIKGLPDGSTYSFEERPAEGYELAGSENASGEVAEGETQEATFTNKAKPTTPEPVPKPTTPKVVPTATPSTGDDANPVGWAVLALIGCVAVIGALVIRRKS